MLEHERYRHVILREAVALTRVGEERLGWQTSRGTLGALLSRAGLDATGRAMEDTLILMRNQKKIVLQKVLCTPASLTYDLADFSQYQNPRDFFGSPFNIVVLPEGTAYLSELEGKNRSALESPEMTNRPDKRKRFAVGARVLVGIGARPGRVTNLADRPSTMGEYVHKVQTDRGEETVLGCDLELVPEAITNEQTRAVAGFRDVHFHGHNSRLNVNSTDRSANSVSERNKHLFMEMRQTAQKIGDDNARNEIVNSIDELEKSEGQGGWTLAYERFVGLLADHITLFAPFLPQLMHIATSLL
jgi:hypothetical protein